MICLQLFLAFIQIGALSFGGGYAAMPLIQAQVITRHGWLTLAEFTDLVTIAEMTPGPIGINAATFVGSQVAGIAGALCATLGFVLPSCLFVTALAWIYNRYRNLAVMQTVLKTLRPAVVSMIFAAGLSILIPVLFKDGIPALASDVIRWRGLLLFAGAFVLLRIKKCNPILVMTGCGIIELAVSTLLPAA